MLAWLGFQPETQLGLTGVVQDFCSLSKCVSYSKLDFRLSVFAGIVLRNKVPSSTEQHRYVEPCFLLACCSAVLTLGAAARRSTVATRMTAIHTSK